MSAVTPLPPGFPFWALLFALTQSLPLLPDGRRLNIHSCFLTIRGVALRRAIRLITLTFLSVFLATYAGAQSATINTLYSLSSSTNDGSTPYSNLVEGPDGSFYGTTAHDGANGNGTIFRITPKGEYSVIYAFQGGVGGQFAESGVIPG